MTEFIPQGSRYCALPDPFPMKRGGELHAASVAFETWGRLNDDASNAVLLLTGLSPNAHAASHEGNTEPGWWEAMLGEGKPIDTTRWFVVCVNSLGSCKGSTGPASAHPDDGLPYRLRFPDLSVEDGARAANAVIKSLGIESLAVVIGCSMGGMTALAYCALHPGTVRNHINISGAARALPFSIAVRSLQREAIRLDPAWNMGEYDEQTYPEAGMRIARKLGVVTYRSSLEWDGRFGRVRLDSDSRDDDPFGFEFQVESYLEGHAKRFIRQFDPNCYLYLSRSMDWFDLGECMGTTTAKALASLKLQRSLSIGVSTDILFPLQQQEEIALGIAESGCDSRFVPFNSPQGHDAFLVDIENFGAAVGEFLASA